MDKQAEKIFKILGEPNRFRILSFLIEGEQCVCKIQGHLKLPQNLVSHHLNIMKKNKILVLRKQGKWMFYSINKESLKPIRAFIETVTS